MKWTVLICVEWNQSVCTALWIMEGYISDLSLTESDALNIWEQNKCFPVKHFYSFFFFLLCIDPCLHACQSVLIVPLQSWAFSRVSCCFSFPSALSALHLFICVSLASCQRLKVGSIDSHVCWGVGGRITRILLFVLLFLSTLTRKICSNLKPVHSSGSTLIFKPFFASRLWLLVSRWLQSLLIVSLQGWNEMEVISTFQLGFQMSTFQNSQYWVFAYIFDLIWLINPTWVALMRWMFIILKKVI